ncbi:MAG TPA: PKD domain-containing protein, partial [Methanomicrobiales archaeon]|nr:PKD domain-containing protein [Methanomicrobiales archaeon]
GIAPLPARFTDTSSGSPTGWSWDFGDGATSADRNPTHTYLAPGNYTVNLSATNALGTGTASSPALIRVLNGVSLVSVANFDGLTVTDTGGREEIVLDTTKMAGDTFDPATPASFTFTPPPSAGWQRMTFSSTDGFGFSRDAGGIIRGNLSSCTLESSAIVPGTFTTGAGNNLPLSYRLDFAAYPRDAAINATVWEGVTPADDTAFRTTLVTTSRDFTSVLGTAYTLSFVSQNLPPVSGATLNVSVNAAWVQEYGNENNIALVRLGDDGINETLNPSATFTDGTLDYFTVPSPHGLSRFGLVAAEGSSNLIQMGARLATQYIQGGQTGHSSNDYSGPSAGPPASSRNLAQEGRPAATYYGEGKVDTTVAGVARGTVIVESADRGAGISIGEGTIALDASGAPLASATALAVSGPVPAIPQEPGVQFTGRAYDLGPDGATFNPPATVSFTVPEDQWRQDASYLIRSYSASAGTWEDIPTSADPGTRTVSGSVSHLCVFGLFTVAAAAPPAQAPPAAVPAAPPAQVPRTPMGTFSGLIGWISAAALGHAPVSLTVLLVGIGSLYTWTRRSWLARYRTWVTLYLASLTGLLWASFRLSQGGPIPEALFIAITVVGLNLIVHVFRFDRITITRRAAPRYAMPARRW